MMMLSHVQLDEYNRKPLIKNLKKDYLFNFEFNKKKKTILTLHEIASNASR